MNYAYCDFCETCLVRACCTEPCYIVDLFEPLVCMNCKYNKTCEEVCDNVLFYRIDKKYNISGMMLKHFQETSVMAKFCKMKNIGKKNYGAQPCYLENKIKGAITYGKNLGFPKNC